MADANKLVHIVMPPPLAVEVARQIDGGGTLAANVTATAISPGTATDVQGILAELAGRITDLENLQ